MYFPGVSLHYQGEVFDCLPDGSGEIMHREGKVRGEWSMGTLTRVSSLYPPSSSQSIFTGSVDRDMTPRGYIRITGIDPGLADTQATDSSPWTAMGRLSSSTSTSTQGRAHRSGVWIYSHAYLGEVTLDDTHIGCERSKPKGEEYIGEYLDGWKDGVGTLVQGLTVYTGQWVKGAKTGIGELNVPTSSHLKYSGGFLNGLFHGFGILDCSDEYYVGTFKQGRKSGFGQCTYTDGCQYLGHFDNDCRQGMGIYTKKDVEYLGSWDKDFLQGVVLVRSSSTPPSVFLFHKGKKIREAQRPTPEEISSLFSKDPFHSFPVQSDRYIQSVNTDIIGIRNKIEERKDGHMAELEKCKYRLEEVVRYPRVVELELDRINEEIMRMKKYTEERTGKTIKTLNKELKSTHKYMLIIDDPSIPSAAKESKDFGMKRRSYSKNKGAYSPQDMLKENKSMLGVSSRSQMLGRSSGRQRTSAEKFRGGSSNRTSQAYLTSEPTMKGQVPRSRSPAYSAQKSPRRIEDRSGYKLVENSPKIAEFYRKMERTSEKEQRKVEKREENGEEVTVEVKDGGSGEVEKEREGKDEVVEAEDKKGLKGSRKEVKFDLDTKDEVNKQETKKASEHVFEIEPAQSVGSTVHIATTSIQDTDPTPSAPTPHFVHPTPEEPHHSRDPTRTPPLPQRELPTPEPTPPTPEIPPLATETIPPSQQTIGSTPRFNHSLEASHRNVGEEIADKMTSRRSIQSGGNSIRQIHYADGNSFQNHQDGINDNGDGTREAEQNKPENSRDNTQEILQDPNILNHSHGSLDHKSPQPSHPPEHPPAAAETQQPQFDEEEDDKAYASLMAKISSEPKYTTPMPHPPQDPDDPIPSVSISTIQADRISNQEESPIHTDRMENVHSDRNVRQVMQNEEEKIKEIEGDGKEKEEDVKQKEGEEKEEGKNVESAKDIEENNEEKNEEKSEEK